MPSISKIEWDIIESRTHNIVRKHKIKSMSIGLLHIVIEQIFPNISDQIHEAVTDGSDDRGVDAIYILESEHQAEVYIFQSKYRDTYKSSDKTINDSEVMKISIFINDVFNKANSLLSSGNFRLVEAVQRIWELHEKGKICRYRVIFCSNGAGLSQSASVIANDICNVNTQVSFEFFGPNSIMRGLSLEGRRPESGALQVIGKEILERIDGDVRGIIASVEARSFIRLIQTDDGMGVKRHLFDDNLRVFLGAKGGFNPSIIETATAPDSYLFWYLNNGITITCKNFSYNKGHANPIIRFDNFQIVNGAQTSHSLVEASRSSANALDDVVLMVRIYATDREDIAERVAVATNSQARIQSRDLRANHEIMKKLEMAFSEKGYFFERKRHMPTDMPDNKRIDALKLGQILLSYDLREPEKAKTESDSIFDSRFHHIFNQHRDIEEVIRIFNLYTIIEKKRDNYIAEYQAFSESGLKEQYLVYGHWFILFTCSLLQVKSGKSNLPIGADAEAMVDDALQIVANACSQHKAVAHYQMFRSARTKEKIYAELGGKQLDFLHLLM